MTKLMLFFGLAMLVSFPETGFCWSEDGHQMTAIVALKYLDAHGKKDVADKVRAVTQQIVTGYYDKVAEEQTDSAAKTKGVLTCKQGDTECLSYESVAAAAIFPDKVKHAPDRIFLPTASWHFINTDNEKYNLDEALIPKEDEYMHKTEVVGDLYIMINGLKHFLQTLHANGPGKGELDATSLKVPAAVSFAADCDKTALVDGKQQHYGCEVEALSFLIHLVGDIHQPLHVSAACDKGGNGVPVTFYGKKSSSKYPYELHAAWDVNLMNTFPSTSEHNSTKVIQDMTLVNQIFSDTSASDMSTWMSDRDVADWANESLSYAPDIYNFNAYAEPIAKNESQKNQRQIAQARVAWPPVRCPSNPAEPNLGDKYKNHFLPVIYQRIAQGGFRLAAILDSIYGAGPALGASDSASPTTAKKTGKTRIQHRNSSSN